jgi:bifunctional non-homologous end joining protein LigD
MDVQPLAAGGLDVRGEAKLIFQQGAQAQRGPAGQAEVPGVRRIEVEHELVRLVERGADLLASRAPEELTTAQRREERGGRLYLDIMRNAYAQLVVAPYSVRGRPGAPVATPLHWDELGNGSLSPGQFTMRTIGARLDKASDDPWANMARRRRGLSSPRRRLRNLSGG